MAVDAVLTDSGQGFDFNIDDNGDIETEDFFDTALLMSFFCERRASQSEVPESHQRRGWIGNEQGDGFEIGSKIWLYEQARITRTLLSDIEKAAFNAVNWLIDENYVVDIKTVAALVDGSVTLTIEIQRPNSKVEKRFFELWNKTGVR